LITAEGALTRKWVADNATGVGVGLGAGVGVGLGTLVGVGVGVGVGAALGVGVGEGVEVGVGVGAWVGAKASPRGVLRPDAKVPIGLPPGANSETVPLVPFET
jgi:hypothetical protein